MWCTLKGNAIKTWGGWQKLLHSDGLVKNQNYSYKSGQFIHYLLGGPYS